MQEWLTSTVLEHLTAALMREQVENGVYIDQKKLNTNIDKISEHYNTLQTQIHNTLPMVVINEGEIRKPYTVAGQHSRAASNWIRSNGLSTNCFDIVGPFTRINIRPVKLTERVKLAKELIKLGWKPVEFSPKSKDPILTKQGVPVDTLFSFGGFGESLATSYVVKHRLDWLNSIRNNIRKDGRVSHFAFTCNTNTGRMTHQSPGENPPKTSVLYGKECREVWSATPSWVMAGYDAAQLELRLMLHYMGAPKDLTEAVYSGNFHNLIWDAIKPWCDSYNAAKNIEYALIYGALDTKLGSMSNQASDNDRSNSRIGAQIREAIGQHIPSLASLIEAVSAASERGYLIGLDGRMVRMTRNTYGVHTHKALNTLLQSAGAIFMKGVWVRADQIIKDYGGAEWHRWLINMHDEAQSEIIPGSEELFKACIVQSFKEIQEYFKIKVDMDVDVKFGFNWSETH